MIVETILHSLVEEQIAHLSVYILRYKLSVSANEKMKKVLVKHKTLGKQRVVSANHGERSVYLKCPLKSTDR